MFRTTSILSTNQHTNNKIKLKHIHTIHTTQFSGDNGAAIYKLIYSLRHYCAAGFFVLGQTQHDVLMNTIIVCPGNSSNTPRRTRGERTSVFIAASKNGERSL